VRAVARAVVRDPNDADDVEQDAWLDALSAPPREATSLSGWFGAVVRNRARKSIRGDARRLARETIVARGDASPSAAELAEIADAHRRVVQAVVELDEPYRAAILLRYFEGLSIDAVAARTASPLETTRSRLKRGIAKLRERLSKELGADDRRWAMALAPLIAAPKGTGAGATAAGGGVVMASTKTIAAVAGALLLVGIGAFVASKRTSSAPKDVAAAPEDSPSPPKPDAEKGPRLAPPRVQRPRATQEAPPANAEEPKPRAPTETVQQRLAKVSISGDWHQVTILQMLAELASKTGVEIVLSAEVDEFFKGHARDLTMEMSLEGPPADQVLALVADVKGFAWTVEEPRVVIVPKDGKRDPTKPVVALPPWTPPPPITVVGRVTDADGVVVVGAQVDQIVNGDRIVATTDIAGRYEVKLTKPYGSLEAHAPFQLASLAVSVAGEPGAQVTCDLATRGAAGSATVRVTDADGKPLQNVWVLVDPHYETESKPAKRPTSVVRDLRGLTNKEGVATFPAVAPGSTPVVVEQRGFEPVRAAIEVAAGKATPQIELKLVKKQSLAERLAGMRITFHFAGANPGEVVRFINDSKQLNIVLDPALAMTLRDRSISLSVDDRPIDETLRALCHEIGDAKIVVSEKSDVVFITADKR